MDRLKVLVVDDETRMRKLVKDFLVKKDKNGIRGNDEAMKMAVTDALGTAAKMISVRCRSIWDR